MPSTPFSNVLISGASIAGPALAWWLSRNGFSPTLVERSPGPRQGGHAIDVRGPAIDVLRAMGLERAVRKRRARTKGMSVLDAEGAEVWRSEEMTMTASLAPNSIEILRDDLSELLLSALPGEVEIIYGDSIANLDERSDCVSVTFDKAPSRKFDLVIGADGIGSRIRKSILGADRDCLHPFGTALAIYSAPNILDLAYWQQTYEAGGGERCLIYTARENRELRVLLAFAAELADLPPDRPGQLALVNQRCGRWGWEVPRLLEHMASATDFYLGPMAQVRAPYWAKGRVATLGDAAFCPSPYTGQGTSLAVIGAYVLASELARTAADHAAAFARYEAKMRSFVEKNQALADLSLDPRFADPEYYTRVFEPALAEAQDAIELEGLA